MELGRCPACALPYSPADVAGFGILRARKASAGGPRVEYTCPECDHVISLVAHGDGRYALPGEPVPPAVPLQERRPPWVAAERPAKPARSPAPEEEEAAPAPQPPDAPREAEVEETPMDVVEALAVLGCSPLADQEEIERAFRDRSRTCHPDKVAHLDPDFQNLAERKFKRLREAYDLLLS